MDRSDDEGFPELTVHLTTWPEAVVVAAVGDLDLATADRLRQQAEAALGAQPPALVVDLGGITFCGSAGMQVPRTVFMHSADSGGFRNRRARRAVRFPRRFE
ncbi:anti-anti-sigma factor [Amycolatopsis pretoriensis]|uniref:Anti-anti-sigma factor n=1 Tax=Amycolatopsis pretoriensis TaxID=218821 RepID=A0A1H5RLR8_9PSEU|nr:STAS domain-containing protein [Amycolatopsis pretoriensis]SEF38441.1 anti-anti-sigma factor [Amycolatopsis pretoriensis]